MEVDISLHLMITLVTLFLLSQTSIISFQFPILTLIEAIKVMNNCHLFIITGHAITVRRETFKKACHIILKVLIAFIHPFSISVDCESK